MRILNAGRVPEEPGKETEDEKEANLSLRKVAEEGFRVQRTGGLRVTLSTL